MPMTPTVAFCGSSIGSSMPSNATRVPSGDTDGRRVLPVCAGQRTDLTLERHDVEVDGEVEVPALVAGADW